MRNLFKLVFLFFAFVLAFTPLIAYSITTEEFVNKHSDLYIALKVVYFRDGYDKSPTASSGLESSDPFSNSMGNLIPLNKFYASRIISVEQFRDMIKKSDGYIDLISTERLERTCNAVTEGTVSSNGYWDNYLSQELIKLGRDNPKGYEIIEAFFNGIYDGQTLDDIKKENPVFYLQMGPKKTLADDPMTGAPIEKINDRIDPTPPIYGDVE